MTKGTRPLFVRIRANILAPIFARLSTVETVFGGMPAATRGGVNAESSPTKDLLLELHTMIQGTLRAFPVGKARQKALQAIQWRLRGPNGEYVGLRGFFTVSFVPENEALIFDGRDNEARKLATFEEILGALTIEILPQEKL